MQFIEFCWNIFNMENYKISITCYQWKLEMVAGQKSIDYLSDQWKPWMYVKQKINKAC